MASSRMQWSGKSRSIISSPQIHIGGEKGQRSYKMCDEMG